MTLQRVILSVSDAINFQKIIFTNEIIQYFNQRGTGEA